MSVAILGTRGIPNRYGGFEQFAGQISAALVKSGFEVYVYNPHHHPFKGSTFKGVNLIRAWDPKSLGSFGQFVYDLLCILDARRRHFNVIIQLGYTTSSIWGYLLPGNARVVYNMDGLEWNREKYSLLVRKFLKYSEHLAIKRGSEIIADARPIKAYLDNKYGIESQYIPYPAEEFTNPDDTVPAKFGLRNKGYHLVIARFQPDNNPEMVIRGVIGSDTPEPLVLIGNCRTRYGKYLKKKYSGSRVIFLGSLFDKQILDNLRYYSKLYFHGHSAGGTNPSLLEAMAASCTIGAHDNIFNRSVLGDDAFYFSSEHEIRELLANPSGVRVGHGWCENNLGKIRGEYSIELIVEKYRQLIS
jgi:hypothetical protein